MRWLLPLILGCACRHTEPPPAPNLEAKAEALAQTFLIIDGHVDLPYRLWEGRDDSGALTEDPSERTDRGEFDFPRAKAGGLNAPFMSIYVPAQLQTTGGAKRMADQLIDMVEGLAQRAPQRFEVVSEPDRLAEVAAAGKIALLLGIENGAALEDGLENVAHFQKRGVRYITLTHSKDNLICDSSYDEKRTWKGLSPYGRQVVTEMNRQGIMVDISHVSDDTIRQVLALSAVPVIASHSSCRHFTPNFERNLSDELIRGIAAQGGVVMINFGSTFISVAARDYWEARHQALAPLLEQQGIKWHDPKAEALSKTYEADHPPVLATVEDVADHIDHVVKLVGVDHVGFGSDFDGVGPTLPRGLEDVSRYPNLIRALLARGYSEQDIEKICGGNVLRVWRAVKAFAERPR